MTEATPNESTTPDENTQDTTEDTAQTIDDGETGTGTLDAGAPSIAVTASAIKPLAVFAIGVDVTGDYEMHWGDGTHRTGGSDLPLGHTYPAAGRYNNTIRQQDAVVAQAPVVVRATMEPVIAFAADPGDSNVVIATFNDDPADVVSEYEIMWDPTEPVETVWAPKGTTRSHRFPAGTHTIRIRDLMTGRTLVKDVEVSDPEFDPDFSIKVDQDGYTVTVTLDRVLAQPAKDILIDWDDKGAQTTLPAAKKGDKTTHKYTTPSVYIIQCVYTDGSTEGSAHTAVIPPE